MGVLIVIIASRQDFYNYIVSRPDTDYLTIYFLSQGVAQLAEIDVAKIAIYQIFG